MNFSSHVVRRLLDTEIHNLTSEINILKTKEWEVHFDGEYARTGALRHGQTFWIHKLDNNLKLLKENFNFCPESLKIIGTPRQLIGRAYWHWLKPGDVIDPHVDSKLPFAHLVAHRYQIYLKVPNGVTATIDGIDFDMKRIENSFFDFNMYLKHSYQNNSNEDFIFMVFDVLRDKFYK